MEFLSELLGDRSDPDDDFHMTERAVGRTEKRVAHSLYLVMSNPKAIDELLRLFALWQTDPSASFEHGLGKFRVRSSSSQRFVDGVLKTESARPVFESDGKRLSA